MWLSAVLVGVVTAFGAREVARRLMRAKLTRDVDRLAAGDHRPLLAGYHEDAVVHFDEGGHRWRGSHRGKTAIEEFLREMIHAGLRPQLRQLWLAGSPWAMTLIARLDDRALDPAGRELYTNRVVIIAHTRGTKIIKHEVYYEDTRRIDAFEDKLRALGIQPQHTR